MTFITYCKLGIILSMGNTVVYSSTWIKQLESSGNSCTFPSGIHKPLNHSHLPQSGCTGLWHSSQMWHFRVPTLRLFSVSVVCKLLWKQSNLVPGILRYLKQMRSLFCVLGACQRVWSGLYYSFLSKDRWRHFMSESHHLRFFSTGISTGGLRVCRDTKSLVSCSCR